ncbi:NAD(P)H-quinone oxidoreductase [Zavarzinia compransoris]|uniref:NAD(P)H-quinone oxidoreductase n=1 Tax=Zavarzinia compransoris TaxID=1264899 RepID=A0A317E592_9PROT|nr:NAD(P)H-quinone oxidoreductase [Zavarzinia compransoris]PWR22237.1 NAD(P)H-quinone oxidoreductase [Zavarzinia compransoris]TDP47006.1 putative PIG3 family NAD(P)H quinone oxidoreductase [Zavarzinia compransoris]
MSPTIPETMTAIAITAPGGPEVLQPVRLPVPVPGPGEVLIRLEAAGINRPDVFQRLGLYPPPPGAPETPGLEGAGTVAALGPEVGGLAVGDRVTALLAGGGYAEYALAPASLCLPVPDGLSMVEAAALPETFFTVWTNVFERGALKPGERFLVHGGASGIGTTAIQLAAALRATVFTTVGGGAKVAPLKALGAQRVIDYETEDFVEVIKAETGKKGVDVVLDMVGGDYVQRNINCMAVGGRLVYIAFLKGAQVEVNLMNLMLKRLTVTGSTLRIRPVAEKAAIAAALRETVWPLLAAGKIRPVIDRTFPLADAAGAHTRMDDRGHLGKIVLTI